MAKVKLEAIRVPAAEADCGITVESCAAYYNDNEESVTVIGELTANKKLNCYATVQIVIYDTDGDILARNYTNWSIFGLMQSFEFEFDLSEYDQKPKKFKVFPTLE